MSSSSATTKAPSAKARARSASGIGMGKPADAPFVPSRRPTDLPGVYLTAEGAQVDEHGILISLRRAKAIDAELSVEVLGAEADELSPAAFLRRVALDPRIPLATRMDAATKAAPYFDRRMPLALEGGDPARPIKQESSVLIRHLDGLTADERRSALALLEKLGVLPA